MSALDRTTATTASGSQHPDMTGISWHQEAGGMKIEWTDDLTVGNAHLDEQHKTLIAMINTLGRASLSVEELGEVIFGLLEYAAVHFRDEEAYFAEVAPEIIPAHFESHTAFISGAYRFVQRFQRGEALALRDTVYDFLCNWLIHHIKEEDRQYYQRP